MFTGGQVRSDDSTTHRISNARAWPPPSGDKRSSVTDIFKQVPRVAFIIFQEAAK
jgi:hypothetical protein